MGIHLRQRLPRNIKLHGELTSRSIVDEMADLSGLRLQYLRAVSSRRRPARFWLVAVCGGIVVVALSVGASLLIQTALDDAPRSTTFTIPVVISLVFWVSGVTYAYNRSSSSAD